jgi:hypothetical protein
MATWKIEPTWKKSLVEKNYFEKDGKTIIAEIGWRWGEFSCETEDDEPPVLEEGVDLFSTGYDIEMEYCDDGCWEEFEFEGFDEDEEEEMREWLDNNSYLDLEEEGWTPTECEMIMTCKPSVEKVD